MVWSCFRWDSSIMQLKLLMLWRDWIKTRSTGRGSGEHVSESSSSYWPVESPGTNRFQVIILQDFVLNWTTNWIVVSCILALLKEWPLWFLLCITININQTAGLLKYLKYMNCCCFCRETLKEILPMLRNSGNPQVEYIIRIMKKWAKDNRVILWSTHIGQHTLTLLPDDDGGIICPFLEHFYFCKINTIY